MKKIKTFLITGATVALLALPVAATNAITVQDQCNAEGKGALYKTFTDNRKDDQAKAYDAAKKYLACPAAAEITPDEQKIIDYLKKWSAAYEEGMKGINFEKTLWTDKNYVEAYKQGGDMLAKNPEDLKTLVALGTNGYLVATNAQLTGQALDYARKALAMIDAGKAPDSWGQLGNKETALAYLNFTVGTLTLEKEPANALKNLIKAAQFETPLKKSPFTYAYIAGAYETGPYAKMSEEYKRLYGGKDETPESKLALANINQIVERMVDGYARAVALAGSSADFAKQKPLWQESVTTWYKFLHGSDAGMTEFIAGVVAKPLPPEPTPITVLPTPPATPAATPTNGAAPANGNGTASTTAPAGTTQPAKAAATPATNTSTKPAGTKPGTNPDRPRNRR